VTENILANTEQENRKCKNRYSLFSFYLSSRYHSLTVYLPDIDYVLILLFQLIIVFAIVNNLLTIQTCFRISSVRITNNTSRTQQSNTLHISCTIITRSSSTLYISHLIKSIQLFSNVVFKYDCM
jgi:hypothetical protein